MTDNIIVSLGDSLLRESDVKLLDGPYWLNDQVIGFYFEYLHQRKFDSSNKVCFISPEVSQFLKLVSYQEIPVFLDPLNLEQCEVILLAVNNASDPSQPGGTHWSLLMFTSQALTFFHLDSSPFMNDPDARLIARKLYEFLVKKRSSSFPFKFQDVPVLKQSNGYDCGIHVLSNAEHATRHFLVYGGPEGLNQLEHSVVRNKRSEVKKIVFNCAGRSLEDDS